MKKGRRTVLPGVTQHQPADMVMPTAPPLPFSWGRSNPNSAHTPVSDVDSISTPVSTAALTMVTNLAAEFDRRQGADKHRQPLYPSLNETTRPPDSVEVDSIPVSQIPPRQVFRINLPACPNVPELGAMSSFQLAVTPGSSLVDSDRPSSSWRDMYRVDWQPKSVIVKFRQLAGRCRLGINCQFRRALAPDISPENQSSTHAQSVFGFDLNNPTWKIVMKPSKNPTWKLMYEPQRQDIRLLTNKISVGRFLSFQVSQHLGPVLLPGHLSLPTSSSQPCQLGIGHDFHHNVTGFKWKLSLPFSKELSSRTLRIRHKSMLPICPGVDLRASWKADYVLPEIHGSMGTGEPILTMTTGQLDGSIDRIETIFTHTW